MASLDLQAFDVAVVPFPFTDRSASKRRPALVLSTAAFNGASGHAVMAMITSAEQSKWPGDVEIGDLDAAGLPAPCLVRLKLFTLDLRLVLRAAGRLADQDRRAIAAAWKSLIFS